jgi:hypothetical protein
MNLSSYIPVHQLQMVADLGINIEHVNIELAKIPPLYYYEEHEEQPMVYAHYFYRGCDWYIQESNLEEDLLYGFAILNGDNQMAELGYINLSSLTKSKHPIELDFYYTPEKMKDVIKRIKYD